MRYWFGRNRWLPAAVFIGLVLFWLLVVI